MRDSDAHLALGRSPYVLYSVKCIDLVSLAPFSGHRVEDDAKEGTWPPCALSDLSMLEAASLCSQRPLCALSDLSVLDVALPPYARSGLSMLPAASLCSKWPPCAPSGLSMLEAASLCSK